MVDNEGHHISSKKPIYFFGGLFLCLIALALVLNVGKFTHYLAFPFLYLFGIGSIFLFVYFYALGTVFIFKHKPLCFRKIHLNLGVLFFVLATLFLMSIATYYAGAKGIVNSDNPFTSTYNVFTPEYYFNAKIVNIFSIEFPIGGGIIGNLLLWLTMKVSSVFAITLVCILYFLAFLCFFLKYIFKFIKKNDERIEQNEKLENTSIKIDGNEEAVIPQEFFDDDNDNSALEDGLVKNITPSPIKPLNFEEKNDISLDFNERKTRSNDNNSVLFKEPSFHFEEENSVIEETVIEPIQEEKPTQIDNNIPQLDELLINSKNDEDNIDSTLKVETPKPKKKVNWVAPSSQLLQIYETAEASELNNNAAVERQRQINEIFQNFNIGATCEGYTVGPGVTRYHISYGTGVSFKSVLAIVNDISIQLGGLNTRFESLVEGEKYSGLEIENIKITTVGFKEVFESLPPINKHPLAVAFGKNIAGKVVSADLNEFPHLLVAGTTGSGKSIFVHSIISTLIMRNPPDAIKIALIDPKKVEMTKYRDMPHLLCPIVTDASQAKVLLDKLVDEMNERYSSFEEAYGSSNIEQYNEWAKENNKEKLPYIIVFLDEYADLVDVCKDISQPVVSIAQKARAAGIHLVIATQRPSVNVITGVIKGNLPTRVALMTASATDSITIVGEGGAEKLLGKGDMLVQSPLVSRVGMVRLQGCFINNKEIMRVVGYLKEHYETNYNEKYLDLVDHSKESASEMINDGSIESQMDAATEMKYQAVKDWVMCQEYTSMSKIQREMSVGFNRAGIFFKRLVNEGIVSSAVEGNKGSKVLIHDKFSNVAQNENPVNSAEQIVSNPEVK